MKMYKVFECAGHRFTYDCGCNIEIVELLKDGGIKSKGSSECYYTTDMEIVEHCLEWLEHKNVIPSSAPYLAWALAPKSSSRWQDMLAEES
jgi:hypothetical protein